MTAQFIKPKRTSDIPSMQEWIYQQVDNKLFSSIQQGIEQYLGEPLTEALAPSVELRHKGEDTYVYFKDEFIGSVTGRWDHDFEKNIVRYVWIWTPLNK